MRFTHPVNTLKKLGCGLAFGAAAIMAMPTSALACTQIYMGSKLTADGNTYYGRSEDFGPRYIKHFGIEPAHKDGNEYTSVESGFEYKSKGATYRYTFVRDNPSQWEDRYDAYSEAGINEKGVSCSATLSTSYNEKAEEADPITEETGIGEYNYASVILGESATAREGVELLGSLIDEQGVCSNDQIIIADNNETWLFAALSGHQWIAMRLTDDIASLNPNIGNLTYDVDLDDTENCLHSEGIESMPKEKGFAEYTDGKFDVAKTYGEEIGEAGMHQWSRYIQGRDYFMAPLAEGTDYKIVKDEREDARATTGALVHEMQPLFFTPGKSDWNTFEMIRSRRECRRPQRQHRRRVCHRLQPQHRNPHLPDPSRHGPRDRDHPVGNALQRRVLRRYPPLFRTAHRGQPLLQRSGCLLRSLRRGRRREQRGARELHQLRPHGHQHARL